MADNPAQPSSDSFSQILAAILNGQGGTSGSQSGHTTPQAWLPKWILGQQVYVDTSTPQGILGASDPSSAVYHTVVSRTDAQTSYDLLPASMQRQLDAIAHAYDPRSTGRSLYERAVATSALLYQQGIERDPLEIIRQKLADGSIGSNSTSAGGSGSAGPQPADETSIRRAMDQVSLNYVGRTLDDSEFKRFYGDYKSTFAGNPGVDPVQLATDRVRQEGDYQEYQVATKFAGALQSVIGGAF